MATSIELEQQLVLRLDREAKKHWDGIIEKMQEMANNFDIKEIEEKSPFRNVLNVATEANSSLEVIKNFIRYQVGRQGSNKIWKTTKNKQLFADAVVVQIDDLLKYSQEMVEAIAKDINEKMEGFPEKSTEKQLLLNLKERLEKNRTDLIRSQHLKLTQLYLGYLSREHTALLGEKKSGVK